VQIFSPEFGGEFSSASQWEIIGWYGNTLDNKPYIKVGQNGHVFITDPESFRILEFTETGELVRYWGEPINGLGGLDLPTGLAIDENGGIWVADAGNHRVVHYTLPSAEENEAEEGEIP
jgi:hypothetical protein